MQYTSASAIQRHRRCNRAWYFRHVAGLPDKPPSEGVKRGLEGHARFEHYFKTGQNTLDPLEQMALKYLPASGVAETEFSMDSGYGFPVVGKIDLIAPGSGVTRIIDYKFKSSIAKYGSNAADFIDPAKDDGVQMLTYAVSGNAGGSRLSLEHIDLQWRGRREVAHEAVEISAHEARVLWHNGVRPELPKMMETARAPTALKVFGNEKACHEYGGCAYLNECFDPITRLRASVRAMDAKPGEEKKTMGLLGKKSSNPNAVPAPEAPEEAVIDLMPDQPETPRPEEEALVGPVEEISEPEAVSSPLSAAAETPVSGSETTELAPKKRGRPRKARTTAESEAPASTTVDEVYLYIGCYPVNQKVTPLLLWVQGLNDRIIEAARLGKQLTDLRASSDQALGYSKWKGYLSDLARHEIIEGRIPPGHYIMLGDDDERVTVVATELASRLPAGHVIRGTR